MTDHPILFIPGPVEVDPHLREIMAMPLVGHRSPEFVATCKAVSALLPGLFQTKAHALFENAPGTALMEAGIRNLTTERVLHLTCGAFGERWVKVSRACGRHAEVIDVDWGQPNASDTLRAALVEQPYDAVAITHNETSTGVLNPLAELAATVHETAPDTMVMVDAVTSLGGAELAFDDWGIDLAFAGTQKCLALPPGLCVYAVSERAMQRAEATPDRGFLLDFVRARDGLAIGKPAATPCVPLVYALLHQLRRIIETETLPTRFARHLELRSTTEEWAKQQGFELLVEPAFRSPTVSTVRASGREVSGLIAKAAAAGFTLGNGYGKLKGHTFRIGHMGDHSVGRLRELLAAIA